MMSHAPVLICVYDRLAHFQTCIESLRRNIGAESTRLFITSDGPRDEWSRIRVMEVRKYIATISGFQSVTLLAPEENTKGQVVDEAIQLVFESHDRMIFSEDDNVFGCHFLTFINEGLDLFSADSRVAAICGYVQPEFSAKESGAVAMQYFTPWGYGLWRDKSSTQAMLHYNSTHKVMRNKEMFSRVNFTLPHVAPMMRAVVNKTLDARDLEMCLHVILQEKFCIFPSTSLVRNIGNDGSGLRSVPDSRFAQQKISEDLVDYKTLRHLQIDPRNMQWIRTYFGGTWSAAAGWFVFAEANSNNRYARRMYWFLARAMWKMQRIVTSRTH